MRRIATDTRREDRERRRREREAELEREMRFEWEDDAARDQAEAHDDPEG